MQRWTAQASNSNGSVVCGAMSWLNSRSPASSSSAGNNDRLALCIHHVNTVTCEAVLMLRNTPSDSAHQFGAADIDKLSRSLCISRQVCGTGCLLMGFPFFHQLIYI